MPGFDYVTGYGIFAPAATSQDVIGKLHKEIVRVPATPQTAQRFASQGAGPASTTPVELGKLMHDEHERCKQVIKSARIKID